MTIQNNDDAKKMLENLGTVLRAMYEEKNGHYVLKDGIIPLPSKIIAQSETGNFAELIKDGAKNHEGYFARRMEKKGEKGIANVANKAMEYIKKNGFPEDGWEYLGQGSRALVLKRGDFVARMSAEPKEKIRPALDAMQQPEYGNLKDKEELDGLNLEISQQVARWKDVEKKAKEMGMDLKFADIYGIMQASLPQDVYDQDVGNSGNVGFTLDSKGNPIPLFIDPGSLVKASDLTPKTKENVVKFKEEAIKPLEGVAVRIDYEGYQKERDPNWKVTKGLSRIQELVGRKLAKEQKASGKAGTASPNKTAETKKDTSNQPPTDGLPPPGGNGGR